MASAQKPRRIGLFGTLSTVLSAVPSTITESKPQQTAFTPASTLLLSKPVTHDASRLTLLAHARSYLKRTRDEDDGYDRPAKQVHLDWKAGPPVKQFYRTLRSSDMTSRARMSLDAKLLMREQRHYQANERSAALAALHAPAENLRSETEPTVSKEQISNYALARDCGYAPKTKKVTVEQSSESVPTEVQVENVALAAPLSGVAADVANQSSVPASNTTAEQLRIAALEEKVAELQRVIDDEREVARSKSAQVLRLIASNTEQKTDSRSIIEDLETKLADNEAALKKKDAEYESLSAEKKNVYDQAYEAVTDRNQQISTLTREKDDKIAQVSDLEAGVRRLNDRNGYLQTAAKSAAGAELEIANVNTDLRAQLTQARNEKDAAIQERKDADEKCVVISQTLRASQVQCKALKDALNVAGATIHVPNAYAEVDMDGEQDENGADTADWRDFVTLASIAAPISAPSQAPEFSSATQSKPTISAFGHASGEVYSAPSTSSFGTPSGGTFGKPSLQVNASSAATEQSDRTSGETLSYQAQNQLERDVRELARKQLANEQHQHQLQAWADKVAQGEIAKPPPNETELVFKQYINSLVAENVLNRMDTSSGEPVRVVDQQNDIGMNDASPRGAPSFASTYVDFAKLPIFGPDAGPMHRDDNAYEKSVSRQNAKDFTASKHNGKQSNDNGKGKGTGWNNNNDWDKKAGQPNGLDTQMGFSSPIDNSKEAYIKGGKNDWTQKNNSNDNKNSKKQRGGKQNNQNKNQNHDNNQKGGANRGRGKGQGNNNNSFGGGRDNNNNAQSNGGYQGGDRGGRGRGGGRGGRGGRGRGNNSLEDSLDAIIEEGNAVAGAETDFETNADTTETQIDEDAADPACFGGNVMDGLDSDHIMLGQHSTNLCKKCKHAHSSGPCPTDTGRDLKAAAFSSKANPLDVDQYAADRTANEKRRQLQKSRRESRRR